MKQINKTAEQDNKALDRLLQRLLYQYVDDSNDSKPVNVILKHLRRNRLMILAMPPKK